MTSLDVDLSPVELLQVGIFLMHQSLDAKAIPFFQAALERDPKLSDAHVNLAGIYIKLKQAEKAIESARKSLEIAPDHPGGHMNLGSALQLSLKLEEGREHIDRAIALNPPFMADCWGCRAMGSQYLGDINQALCEYAMAVELDPASDLWHMSLAMMQMLDGRWEPGLRNYEARISQIKVYPSENIPKFTHGPGESLAGHDVLICAEQGAGDAFMFARYFRLLRELHPTTKLTFACADSIQAWMDQFGIPAISPMMSVVGQWDVQIALMSLMLYFHDRRVPFLIPPERPIGFPAYEGGHGVGFCWRGNKTHNHDQFRSMKFHLMCEKLVHVAKDAGHRTVCLQSDAEGWQKTAFDAAPPFPTWHDTALAINGLDLVVTVDTAVAHLAGTLGVPTLLLLPLITDWRWGMRVPTTPFYPSMRIMRQTKLGDWNPVIEEAKEALCSTSLSL